MYRIQQRCYYIDGRNILIIWLYLENTTEQLYQMLWCTWSQSIWYAHCRRSSGVPIYAPSGGGGGGGLPTQDIISADTKCCICRCRHRVEYPERHNIFVIRQRLTVSALNYYVEWNCSKGKITDRGFRFTPAVGDIGTHSCTCYLYDTFGNLINSMTFQTGVSAASLASNKSILLVSDSLGADSYNKLQADFADVNRYSGVAPIIYKEATGGWHTLG